MSKYKTEEKRQEKTTEQEKYISRFKLKLLFLQYIEYIIADQKLLKESTTLI